MKRIKTLSLFLLMAALVFAGCGNEAATTEAATTEIATTEVATTQAPETAGETTETAGETTETAGETTETASNVDIEKGPVDVEALKEQGKPIFLQFSQDGCPPCEQMLPVIKTLQDEFQDRVIVQYVDARQNMELAYNMGLQYTPTQIFITKSGEYFTTDKLQMAENQTPDGGVVPTNVGFVDEELMRQVLEELEQAK